MTVFNVQEKRREWKEAIKPEMAEHLVFLDESGVNTDLTRLYGRAPSSQMKLWSFYHDKSHQIWLWWAIDHATNIPLAFTFGTREHKNLDDLLALLKPFPIGMVYTDNNFAYHKRVPAEQLTTGRRNTQKIESHGWLAGYALSVFPATGATSCPPPFADRGVNAGRTQYW